MKAKKDLKEAKKEIKKRQKLSHPIYKCEKCGYESPKTFLSIFEDEEYRFCSKCVHAFYLTNFPKAILKK